MYVKCGLAALECTAFLFVFLGVSAGTARAQAEATVRGEVVTLAGAAPLGGVTVTLTSGGGNESQQTTTDPAGRFFFSGVRPGEYVLSAVVSGFAPRELRVVVQPRDAQSVRLTLDVGRIAADVDVVAQPAMPSTHSPSSTTLTAEQIERMPLAQRTNLPDAIVTAAPGVIRGHDD